MRECTTTCSSNSCFTSGRSLKQVICTLSLCDYCENSVQVALLYRYANHLILKCLQNVHGIKQDVHGINKIRFDHGLTLRYYAQLRKQHTYLENIRN